MTAQLRNVRFINADFGEPGFEIVAEHIGIEQGVEIESTALDLHADVAQSPHGERIFVGHEAERAKARARACA